MAPPSESVVIGAAAFLAAGGLVTWFWGRRKDRFIGRSLFLGLPGIYLSGLASDGASKWLYIPGLTLLAAFYVMQVPPWRHRESQKGEASPSSASDSENPDAGHTSIRTD
jgi:hypothetical protein